MNGTCPKRVIIYNPWEDKYTDDRGDVVDISTILDSYDISVFEETQEDVITFDFDGNPIQLIYGYDLEDSLIIFFDEAENMFFNGELFPIYNIYDILNPNDIYLLKRYKRTCISINLVIVCQEQDILRLLTQKNNVC